MYEATPLSTPSLPPEASALDLARMLQLSPTAFSYWDRDLQCRFANEACRDWFGVDPEILVGSDLQSVLTILRLEGHLELADAALNGERRSIVHVFHPGAAPCDGLVQYIPDLRGHVVNGLLIQVSPTPPVPRLARFAR